MCVSSSLKKHGSWTNYRIQESYDDAYKYRRHDCGMSTSSVSVTLKINHSARRQTPKIKCNLAMGTTKKKRQTYKQRNKGEEETSILRGLNFNSRTKEWHIEMMLLRSYNLNLIVVKDRYITCGKEK